MTARRIIPALILVAALAGCTVKAPGRSAGRALRPSAAAPGDGPVCVYKPVAAGNEASTTDVGQPPARVPRRGNAVMTITSNQGVVEVSMDAAGAPCAVASFAYLAGKRFFDNTPCHRLTTAEQLSVLQCGDPTGTGTGGPRYQYAEENLASLGTGAEVTYRRGLVGVARAADPGTSGSQFFIMIKDGSLPPTYTPLGTVTRGMDVVDKVAAGGVQEADPNAPTGDGKPRTPVTLQRVTVLYS